MDIYLCEPVAPFHQSLGVAKNTFTTRQDVSPVQVPVIPAGKLRAGSKLMIRANGEFTDTATVNLTMGLWFGTRALAITGVLAETSVLSLASSAVAWPWRMEWDGVVTAAGVSGSSSITGQGTFQYGSSLTVFVAEVPMPITQALRTVTTFDTTVERAIGVAATWGTSAAGNSITTYDVRCLILN